MIVEQVTDDHCGLVLERHKNWQNPALVRFCPHCTSPEMHR